MLRQFLLTDPLVHTDLGIGNVGQLVVLHHPGEGDQRLDGIAFLTDVTVEALLVAHGLQT